MSGFLTRFTLLAQRFSLAFASLSRIAARCASLYRFGFPRPIRPNACAALFICAIGLSKHYASKPLPGTEARFYRVRDHSVIIDWPGIRANAVHMGIRAAARAAGANLPEREQVRLVHRILKRAWREGWEREKQNAIAASTEHPPTKPAMPLSAQVHNGKDSALAAIADDVRATRTALAKAARKGADAFADLPGRDFTSPQTAGAFRNHVSASATIGGWGDKSGDELPPMQILSIGGSVHLGKSGD